MKLGFIPSLVLAGWLAVAACADEVVTRVYYPDPEALSLRAVPRRVPKAYAAEAVVEALLAGPRAEDRGLARAFPRATHLIALERRGDRVIVDLSRAVRDLFTGGRAAELLLFESLVLSLTELDGVHAVEVRMEGRPLTGLGHLDLRGPLTRARFARDGGPVR